MCGRFLLTSPPEALARRFFVDPAGRNLRPRYNIAPGQEILVVHAAGTDADRRALRGMCWGLWPARMRTAPARPLVNARIETVAERPAFHAAFRRRRCLVPADGWYEWRRHGDGGRRPFLLRPRAAADRPFAFAGIWERRPDPRGDGTLETVAILTMPAAPAIADIHARMPVVLTPMSWARWLDPRTPPPAWSSPDLPTIAAETLEAFPVSTRVNRVANDDPGLIEPIARAETGDLFADHRQGRAPAGTGRPFRSIRDA